MSRFRRVLIGVGLLAGLLALPVTRGAVPLIPSTSQFSEPSQIVGTLNFLIGTINASINPQTMAPFNNNRNLLDNGAMQVQQRTATPSTCALNGAAITSAAYGPDRWGCEVNVAVGAGQLSGITATPTPPVGFGNAAKLVRNSGALTQPQCVYQEIPTYKAQTMQGQNVVFSVNIQALAGLAADQGASTQTANLLIITGTGTDQGFGTWTASPALTPAWTGVATLVNTSVALPTTPAWARYQTTGAIGSTVTEIAVAICFTPTAAGAGTTDGIAFTGAQLEQGSVPSTYEFRTPGAELAEAQRYYWQLSDSLAATFNIGMCQSSTTTVDICNLTNPMTMRTTPTVAVATATSYAVTVPAGTTQACTTLATIASSGTPNNTELSCTVAANLVAGSASRFTYSNTGAANTITVSADF